MNVVSAAPRSVEPVASTQATKAVHAAHLKKKPVHTNHASSTAPSRKDQVEISQEGAEKSAESVASDKVHVEEPK